MYTGFQCAVVCNDTVGYRLMFMEYAREAFCLPILICSPYIDDLIQELDNLVMVGGTFVGYSLFASCMLMILCYFLEAAVGCRKCPKLVILSNQFTPHTPLRVLRSRLKINVFNFLKCP